MSAAAAAAAGEFSLTGADRLVNGTKVEEILFLEPFTALSEADSWSEMGCKSINLLTSIRGMSLP